MKKVLYFMTLFLLIASCAIQKKPIFIKVDNIEILSYERDTVRLKAEAFFKNPNDIGGKLSTDSIFVFVNGAKLARVTSASFKIPARKEFAIPMLVEIPTKRIFESNKNGILGGLLNSVLNKSIKVQFKGDLKYKVLGYSNIYPIDKTEEIKF